MVDNISVSTEEFVVALWNHFKNPSVEIVTSDLHTLFLYGREKGWLEDEDERFSSQPLLRRNAARILHQFMKIELKIPDEIDIKAAEVLKDLYTCRICMNHIAQVYCKKLMDSAEIEQNGQIFQIFDHLSAVNHSEMEDIFNRLKLLIS